MKPKWRRARDCKEIEMATKPKRRRNSDNDEAHGNEIDGDETKKATTPCNSGLYFQHQIQFQRKLFPCLNLEPLSELKSGTTFRAQS